MIAVNDVTRTFDDVTALNHVTLHVNQGSVYGLIGPNGAGKTTLIKHLTGLLRPQSGTISVANQPVFENISIKERIAYISDDLFFFHSYSIRQMAGFFAKAHPRFDWERFHELTDVFGIDPSRRASRLSKGMQKQTAFWLALSCRPDVLILDEPVDGLDPIMRRKVWELILAEVADRNVTVLISSHNLRELEDVCDHVGILYQGSMVLEKELDDVKGNIHKIQLAFSDPIPAELLQKLTVLHSDSLGSLNMLIVRGQQQELAAIIQQYRPLVCDFLPLSLEEVFIYELGGINHEIKDFIL